MDFITKSNYNVPFVNDKSLWIKSLNKQPLYDELLGWHELYNQKKEKMIMMLKPN